MSAISTAAHCVIDVTSRALARRGRELGVAVAAAGAIYAVAGDPHRPHRFLPRCPVKLVTGLDCPACGGMRMAYDVAHGDARNALHDNPFLLICSPLLAALVWRVAAMPNSEAMPPRLAYGIGISAIAWMALRNHPRWPLKPITRR